MIVAVVGLLVLSLVLSVVLARRESAHSSELASLRTEARRDRDSLLGRLERERAVLAGERERFDAERRTAMDRVIAPDARRVELMREAMNAADVDGKRAWAPESGPEVAATPDDDDGSVALPFDPDLMFLHGGNG